MMTVLLGVAFIIGLAFLISAVCERELIRAEREERSQKVDALPPAARMPTRGEPPSQPYNEIETEWLNCGLRPRPEQNREFAPDTSENDEVAA